MRVYRVMDQLPNGVALLNAMDDKQQGRRRSIPTSSLPAGVDVGTVIAIWPTGQIRIVQVEKRAHEQVRSEARDAQGRTALDLLNMVDFNPPATVGILLASVIQTLADTLQIPQLYAARMCETWLKQEMRINAAEG